MPAGEVALAKLSRPRAGKVLARERLFGALDRLREQPVVWIAAQPGAGKTTLLTSYLEARKVRGLWYQLDPGDADCASFFYHLGLAASTLKVRKGGEASALPMLNPEYLADLPGFARRYFRELYARMGPGTALVLDNFQEIGDDTPTHRAIAAAMEELPEGIGLLVASRGEPPAQYLPLMARGAFGFLDAHDVRLTPEETERIVEARADLSPAVIKELHAKCDGWAAGLTLLIERARRGESLDAVGGGDALAALFGHFADELMAGEFAADRDTLIELAALPRRIRPHVARALTGKDDIETLLERLHRRNLFTVRRGSGAEANYEFHYLLRAHLRARGRDTWPEARWRETMARAAAALEQNNLRESAAAVYEELGDWDSMSRVVLALARPFVSQERRRTLIELIDAIPESHRARHPWLLHWHGAALVPVDPRLARERLELAHKAFAAAGDAMGRLLAGSAIVFTHYLEFANLAMLDPWIDELLGLLDGGVVPPSPAFEVHVQSSLLFATAFRRPEVERTARISSRLNELLDADLRPNEKIPAASILLAFLYHTSQVESGMALVARMQPAVNSPELSPANAAIWWMQVGLFSHFHGAYRDATAAFEKSLGIVAAYGLRIPLVNVYCHIGMALTALLEGDLDRAEECRLATQPYWSTFRRMDVVSHAVLKTHIASHRGDWDAALEHAEAHFEAAMQVGVHWQVYYSHIQLAYILVRVGERERASKLTQQAREWVHDSVHQLYAYQADLVDAYAAMEDGDEARLRELLALGLARSRGDPNKFFPRLLPDVLPDLFAAALERGIETELVLRTIRYLKLAPPDEGVAGWPWPFAIHTLGRFEVRRDGRALEYSRKAPKKTLALLKAIIALGGSHVPEQALLDALWPGEEGDSASKSLGASVLRLRALLGDADAVVQQGGKLSLDRSRVWTDAWAFERAGDISFYNGPFLPEEDGPWPVAMRERLRAKFIQKVAEEGAALEKAGRQEEAIDLYMRGLDADSIVEPFYQGLMRCYHALDRRAEAISTYRRLKQILSVTLGLPPSATTERLYKSLKLAEPQAQSVANK